MYTAIFKFEYPTLTQQEELTTRCAQGYGSSIDRLVSRLNEIRDIMHASLTITPIRLQSVQQNFAYDKIVACYSCHSQGLTFEVTCQAMLPNHTADRIIIWLTDVTGVLNSKLND